MTGHVVNYVLMHTLSGLSLKAEGQDFLPASMTWPFFHWKMEQKWNQKKIPSCLIPYLRDVLTQQIEILVTSLCYYTSKTVFFFFFIT